MIMIIAIVAVILIAIIIAMKTTINITIAIIVSIRSNCRCCSPYNLIFSCIFHTYLKRLASVFIFAQIDLLVIKVWHILEALFSFLAQALLKNKINVAI